MEKGHLERKRNLRKSKGRKLSIRGLYPLALKCMFVVCFYVEKYDYDMLWYEYET